MKLHSLLSFVVILIQSSIYLCQDLPLFRIIAPQNICKQPESAEDKSSSDGITISFQPKDGMKFSYKFRIFFKTLTPESLTQRETLLVWKAVRNLEHRINTAERLQISNDNMLFINKSEVVSGVSYIFHVFGITNAGETTKEQVFNILYSDGVLQNKNVPEGLNFLLIGSEVAIASSPYSLHAKVTFCKPKYDYYIRWKIHDLDEEYQELQHVIGTTLNIPPNSFFAGSNPNIEAFILEMNSSKVLGRETINVNIVQRGFQAYIIPTAAKVGINTRLAFKLYLRDFDNNIENIQISWEYVTEDSTSEVISDEVLSSTSVSVTFQKPGRYQVLANVNLNGMVTKVSAEVDVVPNILISYDFAYVPNINPVSNASFQFTAMAMNLSPNCRAGWTCAQEDGYKYVGPDEVGKETFGQIEVSDLDKKFLEEIVDLKNSTVNREITLNIPSANVENNRWRGLQGDARYKFRLDTVCPQYNDEMNFVNNPSTTSHFEFIIHTNSPPIAEDIEVMPENGFALTTMFHVSVTGAKDLLLDMPISYELFGCFGEHRISFGKYFEYKTWEIILPYLPTPAELDIEICDIRNACSLIHKSNIVIEYADISNEEFLSQKEQIQAALRRTDYVEAQNMILMLAITYKEKNSDLLSQFQIFVKALMEKEFDKMMERPINKMYVSQADVVKFVSQTKRNLEILNLSDRKTLEKLLEILEQATTELAITDSSIELDNPSESLETQDRYRRQPYEEPRKQKNKLSTLDKTYIEMNLMLIQDIMKSEPNDAASQTSSVITRVSSLIEKICLSDAIQNENIVTEIAAIKIEKCTGNYLLKKEFAIPKTYSQDRGRFRVQTIDKSLINEEKNYCIVVTQYPEDYFTNETAVLISIKIYELYNLRSLLEWKLDERTQPHAINLEIAKKNSDENTCLLRTEKNWSKENCKIQNVGKLHVTCSCTHLGFFRLSAVKNYSEYPGFVRPTPSKNIISFPNENHIQTATLNILSTVGTDSPTTLFTMAKISTKKDSFTESTSTVLHSESTPARAETYIATVTEGYSTNNKLNDKNIKKGSPLPYVIPLIILLLIASGILMFIVYYRRRPKRNNEPLTSTFNSYLEIRKRQSGVKYATIYDQHLMHGHF